MSNWKARARAYRTLAHIPFGAHLLEWYRRRGQRLERIQLNKRSYSIREMKRMLKHAGKDVNGKDLLEIGSGWHPVLALMFYGLGAESVTMTDIRPHMRANYARATLAQMQTHVNMIAAETGVDCESFLARWEALEQCDYTFWPQCWEEHGIRYVAPLDFFSRCWARNSFDGIFSNSCLCYIPSPELENIFERSFDLLRPGGWIAHNISVYDDYSGADPTISKINFLRYSADEWNRIGNSELHYQNRLRPRDYEEYALRCGFIIRYTERVMHPLLSLEYVNRDELHRDFRFLPADELTCYHFLLVAEKPDSIHGDYKW